MGVGHDESARPLPVRTFGGLQVGGATSFGSKRARTLLSLLAVSERPVHRDRLIGLLWPDDPRASARPRLRTELHRLREALGEAGSVLTVEGDALTIDRNRAEVDLDRFAAVAAQAKGEAGEARYARLREAIDLLRGPLLPHEHEAPFAALRGRWDDIALKSFEEAARLALSLGRPEEGLLLARQGLGLLSDRSGLIRLLMEALAATGDVPEALATYDRYVDRLETESEIAPDAELARYASELRGQRRPPSDEEAWTPAELPPRVAEIFGREEAIAALAERLDPDGTEGGVVNLIGPGGVGKTTVALETARRLESSYRGRVFFVPLASISDEPGLAAAVAKAVSAVGDDPMAIASRLKGGPALLLLDNFEQLVPAGSRWLDDLVRRLPAARILVTSRRSVEISAEWRVPLAPLQNAPSVSLFVDRARRAVPGYAPSGREAREIERLAERLEGLPLALVLAAARVATSGPGEMLRDLGLLAEASSPSRDVEERHRSLRVAIDWSLAFLTPESRAFLDALTVFPNDWTMEAARAVVGPEANELLPELVNQSLVAARPTTGGTRFRLLQMIREHLSRSMAPLPDALYERHAAFFEGLAETVRVSNTQDFSEKAVRFSEESANVEAAVTWLQAHDRERSFAFLEALSSFWLFSQRERRAADWTLEASRVAEAEGSPLAANLSRSASRLLITTGRYAEAQERVDVADRLYALRNETAPRILTLRARCHLAYYQFRFAETEALARQTIALAEAEGDLLTAGLAWSDLSLAQANLWKGEEALRSLERCLTIHEGRNDRPRLLNAKATYGVTLLSMRRWEEAERVLYATLAESDEQSPAIPAQCHTHLTTVCLRTGRIEEAEGHLNTALELAQPSVQAFLRGVRHYLGVILGVKKGDRRAAERSIRELFLAWASVTDGPGILPAVDLLAYALASFGKTEAAGRLLDGSDALRRQNDLILSPHYAIAYEEARALVAPEENVDPPESFQALFRGARDAIWML